MSKPLLLLLLVNVGAVVFCVDDSNWNYDNPDEWGEVNSQCNGKAQSPIHLKTTSSFVSRLRPIKLTNYNSPLTGPLTLRNTGYTVQMDITDTTGGGRPIIEGSFLNDVYEAQSLHFHWGESGVKGSEHVVNNRRYDVELHIIHKNKKYETLDEALSHRDGLAVLGIFIDIGKHADNNPGLNNIFKKLPEVVEYTNETTVDGEFSMSDVLGNLDTSKFYFYQGSLTTPPCSESVSWIVYQDYLVLSQTQISKLWDLMDKRGQIYQNFRPLQPRNGRSVYYRLGFHLLN